MALILASPGDAKDITDISAGDPIVAPAPHPDRAHLKRGDSGGDVPILQKALNNHGEHLTVDGVFGRQTEKAVKDFQAQSGLELTGEVDSGTWSVLSNPARDLEIAQRAAEQAKAQATEFARLLGSVNSELEKANAQRNELQTKLDQATSEAKSAQSQLKDKQSRLEGMQRELETAKQAADRAKAQATDLAKRVASLNSELEKANAQRNELQAKLDQANLDIKSAQARLELEKANAQPNMGDPENACWHRDIVAANVYVGDMLMAQGDLVGALKWYRDGLAVADRLAKSNPENAGWQGDLSISYNKIGDALAAGGNLTEALKTYQESLAIRERLAKADSNNTDRQRDLAISQGRVAAVLAEQGRRVTRARLVTTGACHHRAAHGAITG